MRSSYLALGYDCNHNCICCPLTTYDRLHERIEFEEIKNRVALIPKLENKEENHIVLSGGEPMLHPHFYDILDFLVERDFSITVLSNSTICKDKRFARKMRDYNHIDIVTAIHSSDPKIHDNITGTPGSLLDTLEGLDNLIEVGISVTIKHIFNALTLPTLIDTFDYLERHFPPQVGFQFCTMDYSGRAGKNKDVLFASRESIVVGLESVIDFLESKMSKNRKISVIETPYCFADPYYWKYFEGKIGKLSSYIAPNTDEKMIAYEIDSDCNSEFRACRSCAVQLFCAGVWKSAYEIDHSLLKPVEKYD